MNAVPLIRLLVGSAGALASVALPGVTAAAAPPSPQTVVVTAVHQNGSAIGTRYEFADGVVAIFPSARFAPPANASANGSATSRVELPPAPSNIQLTSAVAADDEVNRLLAELSGPAASETPTVKEPSDAPGDPMAPVAPVAPDAPDAPDAANESDVPAPPSPDPSLDADVETAPNAAPPAAVPAPQPAPETVPQPAPQQNLPLIVPAQGPFVSDVTDGCCTDAVPLATGDKPIAATPGMPGLAPWQSSAACCDPLVQVQQYQRVYDALGFNRTEYDANPSYRHETAMQFTTGYAPPTVQVRGTVAVEAYPTGGYMPYGGGAPYAPFGWTGPYGGGFGPYGIAPWLAPYRTYTRDPFGYTVRPYHFGSNAYWHGGW